MDSHSSVWPLELWCWTPTLQLGPWSCVYRLPRFGLALRVGDVDSQASVWPVKLGIWAPNLRCGLSSWGYGLPCFGVAR